MSRGDNGNVLNLLKHGRVSTLLGEHIPEDEAKVLSNGKLTCTVCHHRPVFDTVLMLGNHRKGKKHILELSKYLKRKGELELETLKKQQLESLRSEAKASQTQLGSGRPEDSQSKRRKTLEIPRSFALPKYDAPESLSPRSGKSQVRRYLKTLQRKRSLEQVLEQKRDNYGNTCLHDKSVCTPVLQSIEDMKSLKENIKKDPPKATLNSDFYHNLSGWIRDKDGYWIKDENAEFDSDEDSPRAILI